MKSKVVKERKCKECGKPFKPTFSTLQRVCGFQCSLNASRKYSIKQKEKESKKEIAKMKDGILTHKDYIQLLQKVFNSYIRKRDEDLPCISCGTTNKNVQYAAGHFYPTTYQALRFNEDNVHKQCNKHCNMMLRGNLQEYLPNLENKIGIDRLQWLHAHRHDRLEISIPEIKEKIKYYKLKIKTL